MMLLREMTPHRGCLRTAVPGFLAAGTDFTEDNFSMDWGGEGGGFRMIDMRYIHCELCFYYYYIGFTSNHQTVDSRGGGPLS